MVTQNKYKELITKLELEVDESMNKYQCQQLEKYIMDLKKENHDLSVKAQQLVQFASTATTVKTESGKLPVDSPEHLSRVCDNAFFVKLNENYQALFLDNIRVANLNAKLLQSFNAVAS